MQKQQQRVKKSLKGSSCHGDTGSCLQLYILA